MARKTGKYLISDYNLGLDIGVGSVGWALMDNNYKLLKNGKQKHLWGYDIFNQAETAAQRRTYRSSRRRYSRRKIRIKLLQDLVSDMIKPVDNLFFKKLKYSYLDEEDRNKNGFDDAIVLFDHKYTDKQYYHDFPTIYHLRKHIINTKDKVDPRLIYLAIHHIVKYRGNFLYEGQQIGDIGSNDSILEELKSISNIYDNVLSRDLSILESDEIVDILSNVSMNKKEKVSIICSKCSDDVKPLIKEIINCILGYKANYKTIFDIDSDSKLNISFKDDDFEEKTSVLNESFSDSFELLGHLQNIYYKIISSSILSNGATTISDSMVTKYDNYKDDLKTLKKISKHNAEIKKILGKNGEYDLYVNNPKEMLLEDFYKVISKALKDDTSEESCIVLDKIEKESFLIKQNNKDNGAIPFQYHYNELEKIIDSQMKYYPCLKENKDKILSLVSFRIPYYVGPFDVQNMDNNSDKVNNSFAWIKRLDDGKTAIRPWNFEEVVDIDETAKRFIDRMRNHCTYLLQEDTLPKSSILLNRFNLYNELNKVKLNDHYFDVKTKKKIVDELFLQKNTIKKTDLINWLINNQLVNGKDDVSIEGLQNTDSFASSLQYEIKFRKIFANNFEDKLNDIETIIEYLTVYNDKKIIKRRIIKEKLCTNEEQLKQIMSIKCSGYGRVSRKLIDGLVSQNINSNQGTIMYFLENTNMNFMQILNETNYGFKNQINELNGIGIDKNNYKLVEDLVCSPALKRGIWQSMCVVKDIVKYMGHEPSNIYIEFAREEGKKKATSSRYSQLLSIYKSYYSKSDILNELKETSNDKLLDEKMYLYFLQNGKCMYSGEKLDIGSLSLYQVDHILPRCYVKDDSLDNKALVKSQYNQRKADNLLLDESIIKNRIVEWKSLLDKNLISRKKFLNLTRRDISEQQISNFISRSLVETRQISVHVKNILSNIYKNTNVAVVYAGISSEYRKKNELYKLRSLNDAHHAHDAYLACLFGKFIDNVLPYFNNTNKISMNYINPIIKERIKELRANLSSEKSTDSYILYRFNNAKDVDDNTGEILWSGFEHNKYVRELFKYNDYFFNYQSRQKDGMLYKATLYKAGSADAKIRIKKDMPTEKYGGYNELQTSFIACYSYLDGDNIKKDLINIHVIDINSNIEEYIKKATGKENVKLIKKINNGQVFLEDSSLYSFVSGGECKSIQPIYLKNDVSVKTLYKLIKDADVKNIDEADIDYLLNDLIARISNNIPKYNKFIQKIDNISYLSKDDKIAFTKDLISPLCGGQRIKKIKYENINISNYGRLQGKIDINKIELLYTSPSGLFSYREKL